MAMPDTWLASQYLSLETSDLEVAVESAGNPSIMSVFPAHALVLKSQSSVLASMLVTSSPNTGGTARLNIKGPFSARTVEYFLRFIYTGILPKLVPYPNLLELFEMANRFEVSNLFSECEKRLKNLLSVDTVCQLYEKAASLNTREIIESCKNFISANCQTILNNDLHFALRGEQNLMHVLCNIPKGLAKDHEWNKKTKDGEVQRKALLRWQKWICCLKNQNSSERLSQTLEIHEVEQEVSPYIEIQETVSWIPQLYMDSRLSDVILEVEGDAKFPAHSLVLNRHSEVFLAMWNELRNNSNTTKNETINMKLTDVDARSAEYMLRFLYTHELPAEMYEVDLTNLVSASRRFEVPALETKCVQLLLKKINLRNCCQLFELAERLDIKTLSDLCSKKILDNANKIFKNHLHFTLSKPTIIRVLSSIKPVELVKDWSKWRCCLLGVSPDDATLSQLVQSLQNEAPENSKIGKSEQELTKRNSGPIKLLFSRKTSNSEEKLKDKVNTSL